MKKYFLKSMLASLVFLAWSCKEELIVDKVINDVTSGGILRNLGVVNGLDIQNGSSSFSITLEEQDPENGNLLKEVKVNVGFTYKNAKGKDSVALAPYSIIPASGFNAQSPTTNGLPVTVFSITLDQLVTHVNTSPLAPISVKVGDEFVIDFELVLTDGRVYNLANATPDVTRTGAFSYFNSQFRYDAPVGDPQRLKVTEIALINVEEKGEKPRRLKDGSVDTVVVTFNTDKDFLVSPTITALSAVGVDDNVIGKIGNLVRDPKDTGKKKYLFPYTAGAALADTISFVLSGGEYTAGFTMKNDTLKNAFIIDNAGPSPKLGAALVSTDASGRIANVSVQLIYEPLKADTVAYNVTAISPAFDAQTITRIIKQGEKEVTINFAPQINGVLIENSGLEFNITPNKVADIVGNETESTPFRVVLGN